MTYHKGEGKVEGDVEGGDNNDVKCNYNVEDKNSKPVHVAVGGDKIAICANKFARKR